MPLRLLSRRWKLGSDSKSGGGLTLRRPPLAAAFPMRRTVQIAGQMENLFGTLDENLKLLESSLHVTTYLHNDHLAIEGECRPRGPRRDHSR